MQFDITKIGKLRHGIQQDIILHQDYHCKYYQIEQMQLITSKNNPSSNSKKPSSNIIYSFTPFPCSQQISPPFTQSKMKPVSAQRRKPITRSAIIRQNQFSLSLLSDVLSYEATLELSLLKQIIHDFKHIVTQQPNLLQAQDPLLVIGDIHGQFYDLMKILKYGEALKDHRRLPFKLLFLGDYVDRGINAVEVMVLLMALKIKYPHQVLMLRGNHESRIMTAQYNFKTECCQKYSQEVYEMMMEAFDFLPLTCIVNSSFFCVHGGISDKMMDIKQINGINRKMEIPVENSPFCDFIWSDPVDNDRGVLPRQTIYNQSRDCSIVFGHQLVSKFLAFNDLSTVIRGHEVFLQGFKAYEWGDVKSSPQVMTVFSAPNYCGSCGNRGAVLRIEDGTFKIKQFREEQPEKCKFSVNFNVLTWTLPEIMRNVHQIVMEMMESIVESHLPELKKVESERRIHLLVQYAKREKLVQTLPLPSEIKRKEMTAQQERNYMFNRSHEYFAELQKLPKNH